MRVYKKGRIKEVLYVQIDELNAWSGEFGGERYCTSMIKNHAGPLGFRHGVLYHEASLWFLLGSSNWDYRCWYRKRSRE